jgi:hypothetical protein
LCLRWLKLHVSMASITLSLFNSGDNSSPGKCIQLEFD